MSEAAEDQGWGKDKPRPRRSKQAGFVLPDDEECEAGKAGVAAARAAIQQAHMDKAVGPSWDQDDEETP